AESKCISDGKRIPRQPDCDLAQVIMVVDQVDTGQGPPSNEVVLHNEPTSRTAQPFERGIALHGNNLTIADLAKARISMYGNAVPRDQTAVSQVQRCLPV